MPGSQNSKRKIMVAVDESDHSLNALKYALEHVVRPQEDRVVLVHAQQPSPMYVGVGRDAFMLPAEVISAMESQRERRGQSVISRAQQLCAQRQVLNHEAKSIVGDAREAILDTAETVKPTMLVMGSRGLGPVGKALMGSVSDYCTSNAKCPVLIVKD